MYLSKQLRSIDGLISLVLVIVWAAWMGHIAFTFVRWLVP